MRVAIIDLGSTSFHAVVVDVHDDGRIERVARSRETLHLGGASGPDGHLPQDAMFRALRSAKALRKHVDRSAPDMAVASATSALRDAGNGDHLVERLERVLRMPIRLLDGDTEAALSFRGATDGLNIDGREEVLVADLGGGSLEIAVGRRSAVTRTATFPLGASRLTALHVHTDPPTIAELQAIEDDVMKRCSSLFVEISRLLPLRVIVAGGTARAIGRLTAGRDTVDGVVIPTALLHAISRRLSSLSRKQRSAMDRVQAKRADVLPAGALVLATLLDCLDAGSMTVSESGLREGLLHELLESLEHPAVGIAR